MLIMLIIIISKYNVQPRACARRINSQIIKTTIFSSVHIRNSCYLSILLCNILWILSIRDTNDSDMFDEKPQKMIT